jgi:uncharacterized protein (DUF1810 family)
MKDFYDLQRFLNAQNQSGSDSYFSAINEIRSGSKSSHWIWYVFPQIKMGYSWNSEHFAIKSSNEAVAFLEHLQLRNRYFDISEQVLIKLEAGSDINTLMGNRTDALKLVSSMTLFSEISRKLHDDVQSILEQSLKLIHSQGLPRCQTTLDWMLEQANPQHQN